MVADLTWRGRFGPVWLSPINLKPERIEAAPAGTALPRKRAKARRVKKRGSAEKVAKKKAPRGKKK